MPTVITSQLAPAETGTTPVDGGWVDRAWAWTLQWIDSVPGWSWALALAILTVVTVLLIPFLQNQSFKAGQRAAGKKGPTADDVKDRRLLIAALVPASLFWIAVLVGSGRGLTGFGREDLHWTGGWELLVPFTLDGVAIAFALLAFRALRKGLNPDRSVRIAGIAMLASALINFVHEANAAQGSELGALYLAILSAMAMLIFDELLAQFEEGTENIKRKNPKFGLRWITWPTNTACAWVAWRNYPPADDLKASIGNAVVHLAKVRRDKAADRALRVDSPAWWMRFAPWVHVGALRVALETERTAAATSLAEVSEMVSVLTARLDQQTAFFAEERASAEVSMQRLEEGMQALRDETERLTAERAEALRQKDQQHASEMAEKVAAAKAEASLPHLDDRRNKTRGDRAGGASKAGSPKTVISDEAAVQKLLSHPGDPARNIPAGDIREWSQKAITEEAGVGYGRAPRILEMVTQAQRLRASETPSGDRAVNQ